MPHPPPPPEEGRVPWQVGLPSLSSRAPSTPPARGGPGTPLPSAQSLPQAALSPLPPAGARVPSAPAPRRIRGQQAVRWAALPRGELAPRLRQDRVSRGIRNGFPLFTSFSGRL